MNSVDERDNRKTFSLGIDALCRIDRIPFDPPQYRSPDILNKIMNILSSGIFN